MASSQHNPAPSPIDERPRTLSERINIATRPVHSKLNRLILVRLPLSLPPYTTNPSKYVSGILHIAPIYQTFESLWEAIIEAPQPTSLGEAVSPGTQISGALSDPITTNLDTPTSPLISTPQVCPRTKSLLAHLRLPGLLRTERLVADIHNLTSTPTQNILSQICMISSTNPVAEFIKHTEKSVGKNPHVLLAYAWVLYMALFSGGRHLRAVLKGAGGTADFWSRDPSPVRPYSIAGQSTDRKRSLSNPSDHKLLRSSRESLPSEKSFPNILKDGLSFFDFDGDEDGEDIKREFKKRIAEADGLLTEREKEDIIEEAKEIFRFMVELVNEMDAVCGPVGEEIEGAHESRPNRLFMTRDSVVMAKERLPRSAPEKERKPSFWEGILKITRRADSG